MRAPTNLAVWARRSALGALALVCIPGKAPGEDKDVAAAAARGREIFNREWLPGTDYGKGGDGLGPVYNESSCVACHNSGGVGGAGPNGKNIDILSASGGSRMLVPGVENNQPVMRRAPKPGTDALVNLHAGFKVARTVVLHRFGTDPNYEAWRRTTAGVDVPQRQLFNQTQAQLMPVPGPAMPAGELAFTTAVSTTTEAKTTAVTSLPTPAPAPAPVVEESAPAPAPPPSLQVVDQQVPRGNFEPAVVDRSATLIQQVRMGVAPVASSTRVGPDFVVTRSQRNPTPLFGLGLIDAIPEKAIEEAANRSQSRPETQGRVSRLIDGRIGRLGWKGQTAGVEDFVLTACAVELGLEVPGHAQAIIPQAPKYQASGLDLSGEECADLVAFVRTLPRPVGRVAGTPVEASAVAAGRASFDRVGCAACHSARLGEVEGLYSDLLLHAMGDDTADDGSYNGGPEGSDEPLNPPIASTRMAGGRPASRPATRAEWRTPPLWGVRDSGPYLHDGRAATLEQAIALHGGQGAGSAQRYFQLSPKERLQVEAFLKSLVAPTSPALASAGG